MAPSASDRLSISAATRVPLQLRGLNLKPSSKKMSEILRLLSTISEISLEKTPSIN